MSIRTWGKPDPKPEKQEKKPFKSIPRKSKKQEKEDIKYRLIAGRWLEGWLCQCCFEEEAEQVHHKKGRKGYADQWALQREITLLHDKRFWLPVCGPCHTEIEGNPKMAMEMGYTLTRADVIVK